jgi:C-terminal processing protease CtpA/Prc
MPGDMLIAYNGVDVVNRPLNLGQLLVPDKKLSVTIRRDGETKDFSVRVARAPNRISLRRMDFDGELPTPAPELGRERMDAGVLRKELAVGSGRAGSGRLLATTGFPGDMVSHMLILSPNGVLGASVSTVGRDLAKVLKLEMGVLVNDVPEETPAWKGGLRTGDVIVNVGGQPVASLNQLRELIIMRALDRAVPLRIIRDKKPQDVNVTW